MLPLRLSDRSGLPIYRQIHDQIVQAVAAGTLKPGDALPSIRVLSAELLVSAITVRKAYDTLEAAGVLERRRGKGTFVSATPETLARLGRASVEEAVREVVGLALRQGLSPAELRALVERELSAHLEDVCG